MTAEFSTLIKSLEARKLAPVYLIDGEESYYLDLITDYFQEKILQPAERDFNLIVLYGKDTEWSDVVNACRRFPMFAERQVVILRDAAQMKGLPELEGYLQHPAPTTVFLIEHRFKKVDGRSKLLKLVKEKGVYFNSEKIKDEQVPAWIQGYGRHTGFEVPQRESEILATYLGNDLQKIANEIEKVRINVPEEKALTAAMIQKYIGISKEYNLFEFPETFTNGDKEKRYRMLSYFLANPRNAPMPLLIGSMYSHFSRLYKACFTEGMPEKEASAAIGTWPSKLRELNATVRKFGRQRIEQSLLLIAAYNNKGVGIESAADDSELLKEMAGKLELLLG